MSFKPYSIKAQSDTNFFQIRDNFYQGYNGEIDTNEGDAFNQFRKFEDIWRPRFGTSGSIPYAANAINNWTQNFNSAFRSPSIALTSNWQPLGPFNKPSGGYTAGTGRLNCIAFDPGFNGTTNKTIYVSSPYGGVWKTIDDGLNWVNLNTDTQLPLIKVSDIAINPSDANMIFIATGDKDDYHFASQSAGVYRSVDGGLNWFPVNTGLSFSGFFQISKILINPSNVNEAYLATEKGIYKTNNATTTCTWTPLSNSLVFQKYFRNIIFKPDNLYSTLYASGQDIISSTDGGNAWTSMIGVGTGLDFTSSTFTNNPNPVRINIDVSASSPNFLFANIIMSTNAGQQQWNSIRFQYFYKFNGTNWEHHGSYPVGVVFPGQADINESMISLAVSPLNSNNIFIADVVAFSSHDEGYNYFQSFSYFGGNVHPDVHDIKYSPDGLSVYFATDGGFYKLTNPTDYASPNWLELDNGLAIGTITKIGGTASEPDLILMGELDCGSNLFDPVNLGSSNPWKLTKGGDGAEQAIDFTNSQIMFSSAQKQTFGRSINGGNSYTYETNPTGENSEFIADYVMHPTNPNVLYFDFTDLYKRTYIGSAGSWLKISKFKTDFPSIIGGDLLTSIAISEKNPLVLYASQNGNVSGGGNTNKLFKTTNGGYDNGCINNCWSEMFPPNQNYITGIAISRYDENKIWVSYSGYAPNDKIKKFDGSTWSDYSTGLPNLPVNNIIFVNGSNDGLYVAMDVGVYYRNATMSQWEPFMENLPNVSVSELEINYTSNKIRAGTLGRGLWESPLGCQLIGPLALSGNVSQSKGVEVDGLITSTETFDAGLTVVYHSTEEIDLLPGFISTATNGSSFVAYVQGCGVGGRSFEKNILNNNDNKNLPTADTREEKNFINGNIAIIPNPSNGTFKISITKNEKPIGVKELKVYDMMGKIIWQTGASANRVFEVDITDYAQGVYYVRSVNEDGEIEVQKLIKQ